MKKLPFLVALLYQFNVTQVSLTFVVICTLSKPQMLGSNPRITKSELPTASARCVCLVKTPPIARCEQNWIRHFTLFHLQNSHRR